MSFEYVKCCKCDEKFNLSKEKCCDCNIQVYDDTVIIYGQSRTMYFEYIFNFFINKRVMTYSDALNEFGDWVQHNGILCDNCIFDLVEKKSLIVKQYPNYNY